MASAGPGFAILFVGLWSALTLGFDALVGTGIAGQLRAASYPSTPGVITASDVESRHDSDGATWAARISYDYTVQGRGYTSHKWRYRAWSTSDRGAAGRIVARYPVGSQVTVRYNPADPADAVLVTGVQGMDSFLLLFLTPFNSVMLGGWIVVAGILVGVGPFAPRPLGVPMWEAGGETRLRLIGIYPPSLVGLAAAGVCGFFAVFGVVLSVGVDARPGITSGVALACAGVGLAVYAAARARLALGLRDLRVDMVRRVLVLPPRLGPRQEAEIAFDSIAGVDVGPGSLTANDERASWRIVLKRTKGKGIRLVELRRKAEAEALADWLRATVGCRGPDTPGEPSSGPVPPAEAATARRP